MALPVPNLDDRRFQELALDRARSNGATSRVTHG